MFTVYQFENDSIPYTLTRFVLCVGVWCLFSLLSCFFIVLFTYFHPDLGFQADNRKILEEIGSLHCVDNGEHGLNLSGYFPFILRQLRIPTRTGLVQARQAESSGIYTHTELIHYIGYHRLVETNFHQIGLELQTWHRFRLVLRRPQLCCHRKSCGPNESLQSHLVSLRFNIQPTANGSI